MVGPGIRWTADCALGYCCQLIYGFTHLMLKFSLNTSLPSAAAFFLPFSLSTSISMQLNTPTHKLTSAVESWATTAAKNSARRREGIGGTSAIEDVITSSSVKVRRSNLAEGGESRTMICGRAPCQISNATRSAYRHLNRFQACHIAPYWQESSVGQA
jgi:hypothetical protein